MPAITWQRCQAGLWKLGSVDWFKWRMIWTSMQKQFLKFFLITCCHSEQQWNFQCLLFKLPWFYLLQIKSNKIITGRSDLMNTYKIFFLDIPNKLSLVCIHICLAHTETYTHACTQIKMKLEKRSQNYNSLFIY